MSIFSAISLGMTFLGGVQQRNSANAAARRAQEAADFNASLIERDIDLLGRQRDIINANFLVEQDRARDAFEDEVQGGVRSGFSYGGFDLSSGTPMDVLRDNAREFDYTQKVARFNNSITNMQISDAQEEAELNAQLARMEGRSQAAGLRAQGTRSLINSLGTASQDIYAAGGLKGIFG
jgi:hypothetical protein